MSKSTTPKAVAVGACALLLSVFIPTHAQLSNLNPRWQQEGVHHVSRESAQASGLTLYTSTKLTEYDKPIRTTTGELVCIRYVSNNRSLGQCRISNLKKQYQQAADDLIAATTK